jgi:hypothetical protein
MTHQIRNMETHLRNTWEFDKWGFTEGMDDLVTMTDVDGLYAYFFETGYKYLFVEMKHWDGIGEIPHINPRSGQAVALRHLATEKNFHVLIGYGDTSAQTVYYAEVWKNGKVYPEDFKQALYKWWGYYHGKR